MAVIQDFRPDIMALKPDLLVCRGDWLKYYQIAIEQKVPYILIEQDVHSLRTKLLKRQMQIEKEMIENAAGVIFTSEDHRTYCKKKYNLPTNNVVIYLRPLLEDLAWEPMKKLPGKNLVYAGGVIQKPNGGNYGYRCYKRVFKAFIDAGWTIHLYGSKNQYITVRAYGEINRESTEDDPGYKIVPHGWIPYRDLLREMSQYTAGLQAYAKVDVDEQAFAYTQTCRPNKTWDYLAAGIPTIGLYPGNCAKIYLDGGWGVVVPDTERSTLENIKLPKFPTHLRYEQVMEQDLVKFNQVIAGAMKKKSIKVKELKEIEIDKKGEDEEMARLDHLWYRLTAPVVEDGRLLHGRGKRIPMKEAIRLGLVKPETLVKERIKKRVEEKAATKKEIETKPLVDEVGQVPFTEKKEEKPKPKKRTKGGGKKRKRNKKNTTAGKLHTSIAVIEKEGDN